MPAPRAGPVTTRPVSTVTMPSTTCKGKRSIPRGAGPNWYSPHRLYREPWHGHSNQSDDAASDPDGRYTEVTDGAALMALYQKL